MSCNSPYVPDGNHAVKTADSAMLTAATAQDILIGFWLASVINQNSNFTGNSVASVILFPDFAVCCIIVCISVHKHIDFLLYLMVSESNRTK